MESKTKVHAEEGKQELIITREFELPVEQLFRAYTDPEIIEQWMGTKVLRLESKRHGSYEFVTTDPKGNKHPFSGSIHDFRENVRIVRTFEMENASFGPQLEFLEFDAVNEDTSALRMHIIFRTVGLRDQLLQMPFAQGINMAHNRLQEIAIKLK
jgi:uncharacterized protein YndB with AHSA1/START domain